jgi:predicted nuclease with TOPRIM domain
MNYLKELEKIESEVKDLEYRHSNVKDGINSIDREIILLCLKERALEDNIKNLKKRSFIVLASEYRRSKEDLLRTKTRLEMIRKDKANLENALNVTFNFLTKARAKLDELRQSEVTNVLQGSFGSNDDQ